MKFFAIVLFGIMGGTSALAQNPLILTLSAQDLASGINLKSYSIIDSEKAEQLFKRGRIFRSAPLQDDIAAGKISDILGENSIRGTGQVVTQIMTGISSTGAYVNGELIGFDCQERTVINSKDGVISISPKREYSCLINVIP